jgi:hypothetical protein
MNNKKEKEKQSYNASNTNIFPQRPFGMERKTPLDSDSPKHLIFS